MCDRVAGRGARCVDSYAESRAQEQFQFENDLTATGRVFRAIGAGFRGIRRGPNGNYYILTTSSPAVQIFNAAGTRVGQIPNETAAKGKGAAIVVWRIVRCGSAGRVVVCDHGANAVKIYAPDGSLAATIPVIAPISAVFLAGDEVAVTSGSATRLVTVYDLKGIVVRDYGDQRGNFRPPRRE